VKDDVVYLQELLAYLGRIRQFTVEGRDAFLADEKTQFAVIRGYEVIGDCQAAVTRCP
jgi:uncharacterized protein with HEPN domain